MENNYVLPLFDQSAKLENVGGKGMSLSRLIEAGLPVPDGFHVTTDAYNQYVNDNKISDSVTSLVSGADPDDTAGLELISQTIGELFSQGAVSHKIEEQIIAAYAQMGGTPVAVRSSGTAEDLPGASFAGQHESYLNIQGTEAVLSAVKRCWASLWTGRAISYRLLNKIDQNTVSLAVVVQKLVFSDSSGVMFTVNPINGKRSEILINAAWGLGEAVVSSLVTPDTAIFDKKNSRIVCHEIADKRVMTVRSTSGSQETPVDEPLRKKSALTKTHLLELAKMGCRIEDYYGMPMDVEWALEKGKLFIVQARPITALPPEWIPPEENVHYSKGSLAEHLPNPVSPLFATMGLFHANKAAHVLWKHMFGKSISKLWPQNGAYTTINGYVYLSCVYKPLLITVKSLSPRSLREGMKNSVPRYEAARNDFVKAFSRWENIRPETLSANELLSDIGLIFDAASEYFTKIQLCLPAAMTSETMLRKLFGKAAEQSGISDMSVFLVGFETDSLRAEKNLYEIAVWIKQRPELSGYFTNTSAKRIEHDFSSLSSPERIAPELYNEWKTKLIQHLMKYGYACYEYDFAVSTPLEEPLPMIESMKSFVSGGGRNPFDRQTKAVRRREQATEAMLNQVWGPRKWLFSKLLRWAQQTGSMREDAICHMGMAHPLIRQMFAEIASRLVRSDAVVQAGDIYWLEQQELEMLVLRLDHGDVLPDLAEVVSIRKKEMEQRLKFVSPEILPEKSSVSARKKKPVWKDGRMLLTGIGTSAGLVTARACVLSGPDDFDQFQPGDVLIAVTTTPAWTPLFASAGAVVTDIGGPLSHSSIVAREYGIPAVMAVSAATHTIQSGQTVTVDGGAGTVTVHK